MAEEVPLPWERQEGETAKAFQAFCQYRDMGPERSLPKLSNLIGKSWEKYGKNVLGTWSSVNCWQARVAAWDAELEKDRQQVYRETILKEAEQDARAAAAFIGKALGALSKLAEEELNPDQILRFWKDGVAVRRQARGLPDQTYEVAVTEKERRLLEILGDLFPGAGPTDGPAPGDASEGE